MSGWNIAFFFHCSGSQQNNKLQCKKNFRFTFIKTKDLSKLLVARIKVYVQDPTPTKKKLDKYLIFDISLSSIQNVFVLKGSFHQAKPFFLGVGISAFIPGRVSTIHIAALIQTTETYAPGSFARWEMQQLAQGTLSKEGQNGLFHGSGTHQLSSALNRQPTLHCHCHLLPSLSAQLHATAHSHPLAGSTRSCRQLASQQPWGRAMPPAEAEANLFLFVIFLISKIKNCFRVFLFFMSVFVSQAFSLFLYPWWY